MLHVSLERRVSFLFPLSLSFFSNDLTSCLKILSRPPSPRTHHPPLLSSSPMTRRAFFSFFLSCLSPCTLNYTFRPPPLSTFYLLVCAPQYRPSHRYPSSLWRLSFIVFLSLLANTRPLRPFLSSVIFFFFLLIYSPHFFVESLF